MKERIETPVFVVFIIGALLFSCFTFILGIWLSDSSHKIDKEMSQMKIVEQGTENNQSIENEYPIESDIFEHDPVEEETAAPTEQPIKPVTKKQFIEKESPKKTDNPEPAIKKENSTVKKKTENKPEIKKTEKPVSSAKENIKKEASTSNKLFYIQIIATSQKKTAEDIKRKFEKKGYNVYLISDKKNGNDIYKIRIGTFKTRAQAVKIAAKIEKEEKIKPWIL